MISSNLQATVLELRGSCFSRADPAGGGGTHISEPSPLSLKSASLSSSLSSQSISPLSGPSICSEVSVSRSPLPPEREKVSDGITGKGCSEMKGCDSLGEHLRFFQLVG